MKNNEQRIETKRFVNALNEVLRLGLARSVYKIAGQIGVKSQYLYDIKNGHIDASDNAIHRICEAYNINKAYIYNGEEYGEIFQKKDTFAQKGNNEYNVILSNYPSLCNQDNAVPMAGGVDEALVIYSRLDKSKVNCYVVPYFNNCDFLATVSGDSLQPEFYAGDIVGCRIVDYTKFIEWGRVYILDTSNGGLIKKVMPSTIDGNIKAVSFNDKYPPIDIPLLEINKMALVVGVIRLK